MNRKGIHNGHRERMKSAVLAHGLDGLNDHQVLEVLLFYGIQRKDTNPVAHCLLDRFGSLRGVLEADYRDLLEVEGMTPNAASLMKFSQLFIGRYLRSTSFEDSKTLRFADTDALRRYYEGVFLGIRDEQIRAMALDDNLRMVCEKVLMEGTIGKVEISARKIADFAIRNQCDRVVLAHNHPNGASLPSRADLVITTDLARLLDAFEIELLDHIIIGRTGSYSLRSSANARAVWPNAENLLKGETAEWKNLF